MQSYEKAPGIRFKCNECIKKEICKDFCDKAKACWFFELDS